MLIKTRDPNTVIDTVILCLNSLNYLKNIGELGFTKLTKMALDNELQNFVM